MTDPDTRKLSDPHSLAAPLVGHRVRLTFTTGQTRTGAILGCGPDGLQITTGIGGRMLVYYADVDGVEDLGVESSVTSDREAPVTIIASTEILDQMRDRWSGPVQVHLHLGQTGWEMTFRTHDCARCTCRDVRSMDDDGPMLLPGTTPCPVHTQSNTTPHHSA